MEELIQRLKEKLSNFKTEEILGYIATKMIVFGNDGKSIAESSDLIDKTNLDSPHKQFLYLIGLLMSTEYSGTDILSKKEKGSMLSKTSNEFTEHIERNIYETHSEEILFEKEMEEIFSLLKEITNSYIFNFIPKDIGELNEIDEERRKQIEASLPMFLSYFNMAVLRYEEQIIDRIMEWVSPFDGPLEENLGVNSTTLISFYRFVEEKFLKSLDEARDATTTFFSKGFGEWRKLAEKVEQASNEEDIIEIYENIIKGQVDTVLVESGRILQEKMDNMMTISYKDIANEFGNIKTDRILSYLSIERKSRDFSYYTEENPIFLKPLCKVRDDRFFVVHPKYVLEAIYNFLINNLEEMHNKGQINFYKLRGDKTEEVTERLFKRILGEGATVYRSVCEIPKSEEHDFLIKYKDKLLIVEVKSSKIKAPMRTPEKAYIRIKDNFFSKSGVGGAYYQAIKLKKFIMSKDEVTLYHDKEIPFKIKHKDFSDILTIVITAEQFGPMNVNMSSLLQPEDGEQYPWSCNLYDFENLIEMFLYLNRTSDDFIEYIRQRIMYHAKFICFDELEIAEEFLIEGDFHRFKKADKIFFMNPSVNLMDKIYYEKHGIEYDYPNLPKPKVKSKKKIGRNMPCPCGSGNKYKKCCGK